MKNILFLFPITLLLMAGCVSVRSSDFIYFYDRKDTGLSSRINIDGYYVSERECDSTFFSVFMFYPDGLMPILLLNVFQQEVNLKYVSIRRGVLIGLSVIQLRHRR